MRKINNVELEHSAVSAFHVVMEWAMRVSNEIFAGLVSMAPDLREKLQHAREVLGQDADIEAILTHFPEDDSVQVRTRELLATAYLAMALGDRLDTLRAFLESTQREMERAEPGTTLVISNPVVDRLQVMHDGDGYSHVKPNGKEVLN
jgi:hypothetical protein